jgi:uncharacterized spore protein YtfJ
MEMMEILNSVIDKLKKIGGVELSFGNPQTVNDLTVIPVAKVAYGFGGGSGPAGSKKKKHKVHAIDETSDEMIETEPAEPPKPEEMGMGGGGGMHTSPVGIFVFRKEKVSFYPVLAFKELAVAGGIILFIFWRLLRKK